MFTPVQRCAPYRKTYQRENETYDTYANPGSCEATASRDLPKENRDKKTTDCRKRKQQSTRRCNILRAYTILIATWRSCPTGKDRKSVV